MLHEMKRPCVVTAGGVAIALMASVSAAAGEEAACLDLGWEEMVRRGVEGQPALKAAEADIKAGLESRKVAGTGPAGQWRLEAENGLGTGEHTGIKPLETSLSWEKPWESRAKKGSRLEIADAKLELARIESDQEYLEIKRELLGLYLDAIVAQEEWRMAQAGESLAESLFVSVVRRLEAGAASSADSLRAGMGRLRAMSLRKRAAMHWDEKQRQLAAAMMMSDAVQEDTPCLRLPGLSDSLPAGPSLGELWQRVKRWPRDRRRLALASLAAIEAKSVKAFARPDPAWEVGVKHYGETGDQALRAGLTWSLGNRARTKAEAGEANAKALAQAEKGKAEEKEFRSQVLSIWSAMRIEKEKHALAAAMVPQSREVIRQTEIAYAAGRLPLREILAAQEESLAAQTDLCHAWAAYMALWMETEEIWKR